MHHRESQISNEKEEDGDGEGKFEKLLGFSSLSFAPFLLILGESFGVMSRLKLNSLTYDDFHNLMNVEDINNLRTLGW